METTFIYALCEPESQEVRYVGKSDNPDTRLVQHFSSAKKNRNHLSCWLNKLRAEEKAPRIEILDEVPDSDWQNYEREYIKAFRALGFQLVNHTDGGEGAKYFLGKKFSLEHRQRIGDAHRNKIVSEATREKQRIVAQKRQYSLSTREKISAGLRISKLGNKNWLGKKHSAETKEKMSAARTRYWATKA